MLEVKRLISAPFWSVVFIAIYEALKYASPRCWVLPTPSGSNLELQDNDSRLKRLFFPFTAKNSR